MKKPTIADEALINGVAVGAVTGDHDVLEPLDPASP